MFYTYLIVNNIAKMFYYGARYSEKAKLDDLFTSYFTSSKRVKKDIDKYGKEAFLLKSGVYLAQRRIA